MLSRPRASLANYSVEQGQAYRLKVIYFENDREFTGLNQGVIVAESRVRALPRSRFVSTEASDAWHLSLGSSMRDSFFWGNGDK